MLTDGRADKHDEANSRFSQFCEKRLKGDQLLREITCFLKCRVLMSVGKNITFLHPSTYVRTLSERREYTRVCIAIYLRQSHMSHHAASSDGYACCLSLLFTRSRNTVECFSIASPGPACCDPSNLLWPISRFSFTNILQLQQVRILKSYSKVSRFIAGGDSHIGQKEAKDQLSKRNAQEH